MVVFLSAVSSEFRECREQLASDLRAVGCEVKVQEDFRQHGGSLLQKLEDYIEGSDRVIALVGDAYGCEPDESARPLGRPRRSYTQWEFFLACGERLAGVKATARKTFVYFATQQYRGAHPVEQTEEAALLQKQFAETIAASGKDRAEFGSADELCRRVLRDGWQMQDRPRRPVALPYRALGRLFKGREGFMAQLRESLQRCCPEDQAASAVSMAVWGMGGVGKTRLAVEYAWEHAQEHSAVLFVPADSPQSLRRNLAGLVGPFVLDLPDKNAPDEEVRIAAALRWLNDHPGWFLILDNVDTEEAAAEVETQLARLYGGQVLITSRLGRWGSGVESLRLDVLREEDSAQFLLERTASGRERQPTDAEDAHELAHALGGLALGLEQAGAYIAQRRRSFRSYLHLWRAAEPAVRQWHDERLMKYPRSLAVTWQTTFSHLRVGDLALLRLLAWLAPEAIPVPLFETDEARRIHREAITLCRAVSPDGAEPPGACDVSPEAVLDALSALADYSMLRWDTADRTVTVHVLLQETLRMEAAAEQSQPANAGGFGRQDQSRWASMAARLVDSSFPAGEPFDNWETCSRLLPHALAIKTAYDSYGMAPLAVGRLLCEAGSYLRQRYQLDDAEPLCALSLAVREETQGPDHEATADSLYQLGWVKQRRKQLAEAIPLYERALAIYAKTAGRKSAKYADVVDNLGILRDDLGDHLEAERRYRECLAVREKLYGHDSLDVASTLSNLGTSYADRGQPQEAHRLYEEALAICTRIHRLHDPKVTVIMGNLAFSHERRGELRRALELRQQALDVRAAALGNGDRQTLDALKAVLRLQSASGAPETALQSCDRFLAAARKQLSPEHASIAEVYRWKSELARHLGKDDDFEAATRSALAALEKAGPPRWHELADANAQLAQYHYQRGDYSAAAPLDRRAAELYEKVLPTDHPGAATAWYNCAVTARNTGHAAEAEGHLRHALELAGKIPAAFPVGGPMLRHWLTHLATILVLQDKLEEGRDVLSRCQTDHRGTPDITTARGLFLRFAIARLLGTSGQEALTQLTGLLGNGPLATPPGLPKVWTVPTVLAHLCARLPQDAEVLTALLAVLDGSQDTARLEAIAAWRELPSDRRPAALANETGASAGCS